MRKIAPALTLILFLLLFISELFFTGCASRSTPSGGPRDTTAPRIDTSYPANGSINYRGQQLRIEFNEYISLKNPSQQINFSPPLSGKPEYSLKGKELLIEWDDSLKPNTTYTISFGESIADFTEGNVNSRLKFVFSTGTYLDSLKLEGKVTDGQSSEPEVNFLVALYDHSDIIANDSLPFKEIPAYYTYTDENGEFNFENLRYGNFHVISFEDARGNFRINTGTEKIGFLNDSLILHDSTEYLKIESFKPEGPKRFFGARHIARGQIELAFNYPVKAIRVTELLQDTAMTPGFVIQSEKKDTVYHWFDPAIKDSLSLVIYEADSLIDSTTIYLRPFKKKDLTITPRKSEFAFNETVLFETDRPILNVAKKKILIQGNKDSLNPDSIIMFNRQLFGIVPRKRPREHNYYFEAGAVKTYEGSLTDSLNIKIINLRKNELGNLLFHVTTDYDGEMILQIIDDSGETMIERPFTKDTLVEMKNHIPGIYKAQIIIDTDKSGTWSTGSYLNRIQAEQIIKYQEDIEVRANWDLELTWIAEIFP